MVSEEMPSLQRACTAPSKVTINIEEAGGRGEDRPEGKSGQLAQPKEGRGAADYNSVEDSEFTSGKCSTTVCS